ncbi:MAG: folate-binding protein, partial [Actinomycetota bacterium]|nr:folate-binding protein [Actinomycetota bacterium]MEE3116226.1 folate-binding protein [Actinomycetota bacterium]
MSPPVLFRRSRDVIAVWGPDAESYLQGQLSQDVAALADGNSAWSFVLQPTGKVDAWLRITRRGEGDYLLDVDGGFGGVVESRLRRFL